MQQETLKLSKNNKIRTVTKTGHQLLFVFLIFAGILLLQGEISHSASFDIQPIKLFFNAKIKAGKLMIRNVSDDELSLQVRAFKWSQDKDGKDIYGETSDIVIFPKVLKVPKGEERIIRVGTKMRPTMLEETYRVYAEELLIEKEPTEGVGLRIAMRVGVPVFIAPQKGNSKAILESLTIQKGKATFRVKNDGNVHFIITSLKLTGRNERGAEAFSRELGGWYLLAGAARTYETDIPNQVCTGLTKLSVEVKTTRNSIQEELDVTRDMCSAQGK